MPKITEMYAFVVADKNENDEGIIGMNTVSGWMPFVGADLSRVDSIRPFANRICTEMGKKYKILRFNLIGEIK